MDLIELRRFPTMRVGSLHSALVVVTTGRIDGPTYDAFEQVQANFIERVNRRISTLWVITRVLSPGDATTQEKSKRLAERFASQQVGAAVAITAPGLQAVLVRAALVAFTLMAKRTSPMDTFRATGPAVEWLRGLPDQDPAVAGDAELAAAVERFVLSASLEPGSQRGTPK